MKKNCLFLLSLLLAQTAVASLNLSTRTLLYENDSRHSHQLVAYVKADNQSKYTPTEDVDWATSDNAVATVDATGLVTTLAAGNATITATYRDNPGWTSTCEVIVLPAGGTALPTLREDLVWVSAPYSAHYYIWVGGDTVCDGMTYKKVHRMLPKGVNYPKPYGEYINGFVIDNLKPVAYMREANGRVYRLVDHTMNNEMPYFLYEIPRSESRSEIILYDFNSPNVYKEGETFSQIEDAVIEGISRRVYCKRTYNNDYPTDVMENILMVEGLGMLMGHRYGCDLIAPYRREKGVPIRLGVYYVRNHKGDVITYNDLWVGTNGQDNYYWAGDPYDFSGDGNFDIDDVNAIINFMLRKQEDDEYKTADLTFDGSVDIEDLNLVINRLLGGVRPVKYSEILWPKAD